MYQALYRKYRPMNFDDSIGQENIAKILKTQIDKGETSHAYLFTGVRGTGKTSFAKIFARAVNCLKPKNGEPCNECENCKLSLSNEATDIIEMDAASNTGVDNIRNIINEVYFVPTKLKYRIYIIDEAHMLSNSAWNAFLKTLEEPPKHAKFILATTEPQKLLPTILSRCQRFDFKRIDEKDIFKNLAKISKKENLKLEPEALKLISNLADGSMRDGISILESVRSIDKTVSLEDIREIIGIPNFKSIILLAKSIILSEQKDVLDISESLLEEGKEPHNIITELLKVFESILLSKKDSFQNYTKEEQSLLKGILDIYDNDSALVDNIYYIIKKLSEIYTDLKFSNNKNIIFLASLLSLCNNHAVTHNIQDINTNMSEDKRTNEAKTIENNIEKEDKKIEKHDTKKGTVTPDADSDPNSNYKNNSSNTLNWNSVMQNLTSQKEFRIFVNLVQAKAQIVGDTVEIKIFKSVSDTDKSFLQQADTLEKIQKAIMDETNIKYNINLIFGGNI